MVFFILFLANMFFLIFSLIIFVRKAKRCIELTDGKVRTKRDLMIIKDVINFNMRTAFFTILFNLFVFISGTLHLFIYKKIIYFLSLFFYGVFSFVVALISKRFEDMIRNIEIFEIEPDVGKTFLDYLEQWTKRQISLKDRV